MSMTFKTGSANRLGNRKNNQDRMAIVKNNGSVLLVVADGLGGHHHGEVAAEKAVEVLSYFFSKYDWPISDPAAFLKKTILKAHKKIIQTGQEHKPPIEPRTTIVACVIQNGYATWAHCGDSRFYQFRAGKRIFRSEDHSKVQELINDGLWDEEKRDKHPRKNHVTSCLGDARNKPRICVNQPTRLELDDTLLLCTDGLWDAIHENQLLAYACQENLDKATREMAEFAEKASYPRSDNITIATFRLERCEFRELNHAPNPTADNDSETQKMDLDSAISHMRKTIANFKK